MHALHLQIHQNFMLLAITVSYLLGKAALIGAIVAVSLGLAMYSTWAERKVAAIMQDRVGPQRAGPLVYFSLWQMD